MLILAFDTSGAGCSVVVWRDGAVLAHACEPMDRGQAEALMPMIDAAMIAAGVRYADLDRIAVTVGPGSFTGVRVGLATARGFALATGKPAIGLLTTEVLAAAVPAESRQRRILAAIDTKRGDLYVQLFDANARPLTDPAAIPVPNLTAWVGPGPVVAVGDGAAVAAAALGEEAEVTTADSLADPVVLAALAAARSPTPRGPLPVYVHPPAITAAMTGKTHL